MISRAEKDPAQSTTRNIREISFDRFGLGDVDLVKIALGESKRVSLEKLSIDRDSAVFAKLKEGNFGRRSQLNIMAGGFFQKKPRQCK